MTLHELIGLQRRYTRSINLERDYFNAEALKGYVPTARALEVLARLVDAAVTPQSVRSWTISGVYGTGKSALGLFLGGIFAGRSGYRNAAVELLGSSGALFGAARTAAAQLPANGFLLAFAVGQREPLSHVVTRAVAQGAQSFWRKGERPEAAMKAIELADSIQQGTNVGSREALATLKAVAAAAKTGVLLVVDELGKVLEHAVTHRTEDDLFLLQQIAELPNGKKDVPILALLMLHQSFADYAMPLQAAERAEWGKVQGRFEDVPYAEGPGAMVRLLSQAITRKGTPNVTDAIDRFARAWDTCLSQGPAMPVSLDDKTLASLYPLHPLAAIALPVICAKYAQNDRSLFSFMASSEPHGFQWFLRSTEWRADSPAVLKAHHLYDYFVETARLAAASRPEFQRWTEIQSRVEDCAAASPELVEVVKTVGLFNLMSMTGTLRASRALVVRALADHPGDFARWEALLDEAIDRHLVTWRRQADELRVWEGSDFDVELALAAIRPTIVDPLPALLERLAPLQPVVARRHSYESGTLRFYERRYVDRVETLAALTPSLDSSDGVLVHWLGDTLDCEAVPAASADGRPIVVLETAGVERLATATREVVALETLETSDRRLQSDGIARREVRQRLAIARTLLSEELQRACGLEDGEGVVIGREGRESVGSWRALNRFLSTQCDEVYVLAPRLWCELLNRRELTTQGAKARRELIAAMLDHAADPTLGLGGYGPEVSMARSTLTITGLHRELQDGQWGFARPEGTMRDTFDAIATFVAESVAAPRSIQSLFDTLRRPPYGLKAGPLPVLLAAYVIAAGDDIGLYQDGTFIPAIGNEHFELLMKHPHRFSLKSFHVAGDRARLKARLAERLGLGGATGEASLVAITKRLLGRSRRWPDYTRRSALDTQPEAAAFRDALLSAREPDVLLFRALPDALGLAPVGDDLSSNVEVVASRIADTMDELDLVYPALLRHAVDVLADAFELPRDIEELRQAFRRRGGPVLTRLEGLQLSPRHEDALLRRFLIAVTDDGNSDQAWAESTLMIAVDRPVEAWADADTRGLHAGLAAIARRFRNVEAFMAESRSSLGDGFEGRRITLSQPDGTELARMVWLDQRQRSTVDRLVDEVLGHGEFRGTPALKEAFVAALVERVFSSTSGELEVETVDG